MNRRTGTTAIRPLHVAVLAHLRHPIAQPFAGGMEAHSYHLARGLVARGHRVTLYASGDSAAGVPLIPTLAEHTERRLPWHRYRGSRALEQLVGDACERAVHRMRDDGVDIVHNNTLYPAAVEAARCTGMPMLTSLHVPPFERLARTVDRALETHLHFSVTSARQRTVWWGAEPPANAHVVHNGIDLADWPFGAIGDGSAVWAGRIAANKGPHLAARAARLGGRRLTLIGPIEEPDYHDAEIAPLLGDGVDHVGHCDGAELARRFAAASVALFTPRWEEPFGLVAIEAMACGLPVASIERGAAREVIGEAGAYAAPDCASALARALDRAAAIPRHVPRERVERLFARATMLEHYERLYRRCIEGSETEPRSRANGLPIVSASAA